MTKIKIALIGNPNCGKTTIFNQLTGLNQKIGNWPGVTVEKKTGHFEHTLNGERYLVEVTDLPGLYALSDASIDEKVALEYIMTNDADLIVNIIDASQLNRSLYLTLQLIEIETPLIIVLNMMDIVEKKGIKIEPQKLEEKLNCRVIPMIASKGIGIKELKDEIIKNFQNKRKNSLADSMPTHITNLIDSILPFCKNKKVPVEVFISKYLDGDKKFFNMLTPEDKTRFEKELNEVLSQNYDISQILSQYKYKTIEKIVNYATKFETHTRKSLTDRLDSIFLNNYLGVPIFFLFMYLVFWFSIVFSSIFIDFFDKFFGLIFVDLTKEILTRLSSPDWIIAIISDGIGGGIQTLATFVPPIASMFLAISILEDSGYMARAALLMDRFMRMIGLPGKAVVPAILGFGCNVPAVLATRTLENHKDRILTVIMIPFISCGARLPIYALFATAFFQSNAHNIVFILYLIGILFAVFSVIILRGTILRGEITPFVIELPEYHLPTIKGVLLSTWERLKGFIIRAGHIILPLVIVLNLLNSFNFKGELVSSNTEESILSNIGKAITPIFKPIGITEDNWPATVGIFTGILAKEAVVGTLNSLYSTGEVGEEDVDFSFNERLTEAFMSIPENFKNALSSIFDPLGLSIIGGETLEEAAEKQGVSVDTLTVLAQKFDGQIGAFSYLLFILMYFPCVGVLAAIYKELSAKWMLFSAFWTSFTAYTISTIFYQTATFNSHPKSSLIYILIMVSMWFVIIISLELFSKKLVAYERP